MASIFFTITQNPTVQTVHWLLNNLDTRGLLGCSYLGNDWCCQPDGIRNHLEGKPRHAQQQVSFRHAHEGLFLNVILNDVGKSHLHWGDVGTMFYSGVLNCMYATRKVSRVRTLHSPAASWQAASSACLLDIPAVMDLESWVGQAFFSFSFGQGIFATLKEKKLSVVACPQCITFGRVCLSDSSPEATERGQRSGTLAPQGPSAPFHGLFCVQQFLIILHFPQQHRQIISAEQIRKQYFSFNPNVSWSEQPQQSVVPAWGQAMLTIQN